MGKIVESVMARVAEVPYVGRVAKLDVRVQCVMLLAFVVAAGVVVRRLMGRVQVGVPPRSEKIQGKGEVISKPTGEEVQASNNKGRTLASEPSKTPELQVEEQIHRNEILESEQVAEEAQPHHEKIRDACYDISQLYEEVVRDQDANRDQFIDAVDQFHKTYGACANHPDYLSYFTDVQERNEDFWKLITPLSDAEKKSEEGAPIVAHVVGCNLSEVKKDPQLQQLAINAHTNIVNKNVSMEEEQQYGALLRDQAFEQAQAKQT